MARLRTSFTQLMGCTTPVVLPPMLGAVSPQLAAAVSLAGGYAFLPSPMNGLKDLQRHVSEYRSLCPRLLGVGVGFLGWRLDRNESDRECLAWVLKEGDDTVQAVWLSFGEDLKRWVDIIRTDGPGKKLVVLVGNIQQAEKAVQWGADVIVAQGTEAGGHGLSHAKGTPLLRLLPSILPLIPSTTPVLAAGGLVTPSHLASVLALGASGAVFGTRMLATPEALYSPSQKERIVAAGEGSTVRSMAFDEARGTTQWPPGVDGRGLAGETVSDYDAGKEGGTEGRMRRYMQAVKEGDADRIITWAGEGAALVNEVKPAGEIVQELTQGAVEALKKAAKTVVEAQL